PVQMSPPPTMDIIKQRMQQYEEISQVALAIMIAGCYFGTQAHEKLWIDLLQRVANFARERAGFVDLLKLRRYPALLLVYGGGVAAVASDNYGTLLALLIRPKVPNEYHQGTDGALLHLMTPYDVIGKDAADQVIGQSHAPVSDHFF